jgi:hypothetical protein
MRCSLQPSPKRADESSTTALPSVEAAGSYAPVSAEDVSSEVLGSRASTQVSAEDVSSEVLGSRASTQVSAEDVSSEAHAEVPKAAASILSREFGSAHSCKVFSASAPDISETSGPQQVRSITFFFVFWTLH